MSTLENIGLTEPENQPNIIGPLIDVHVLGEGAGDDGVTMLRSTNAPQGGVDDAAGLAAGGMSKSNQFQIWKYLALTGYLGEEMRQRILDNGYEKMSRMLVSEELRYLEAGFGGPSAAQPRAVDPQSNKGLDRLKSQLGITIPKTRQFGAVDSNLALLVTNAWRYNTLFDTVIDKPTFLPGSTVYYTVTSACYLDAARVADELREAVNVWAKYSFLSFVEVGDPKDANLVVSFDSLNPKKDKKTDAWEKLGFDDNSHVYSFQVSYVEIPLDTQPSAGNPVKITLDTDWAFWMLQSTRQTANPYSIKDYFGTFFLFQVLLHDIGSALGLADSNQPDDVMCPFYNESHKALTQNDIQRVSQLYPKPPL